jgi:hypothetical protein
MSFEAALRDFDDDGQQKLEISTHVSTTVATILYNNYKIKYLLNLNRTLKVRHFSDKTQHDGLKDIPPSSSA